MVIPIVVVIGGISIPLYLRHRSIQTKEQGLTDSMKDGAIYLQNDNYQRAVEEYGEAKKLADSLKKEEEALLADQYKKLSEEIILADESLIAGEYGKAQGLYLMAREMSEKAGNVGKNYIDGQLNRAKDYIAVYDLIGLGEKKEEYGNLEGAIAAYKEAREKAADIYDREGKTEALEKQAAAEEKLEKTQQEEEARKKEQEEAAAAEAVKQQQEEEAALKLENQQKTNDQQNAMNIENQGNMLFAQGQYESAITFYQTAQAIYRRLELDEPANNLNPKIDAARAGMNAAPAEATIVEREAGQQ